MEEEEEEEEAVRKDTVWYGFTVVKFNPYGSSEVKFLDKLFAKNLLALPKKGWLHILECKVIHGIKVDVTKLTDL